MEAGQTQRQRSQPGHHRWATHPNHSRSYPHERECAHGRGEEIAETRLAGQHLASPIAAGDRLYFSSDRGTTFVVRAGTSFEVLAENPIGEPISASPAIAEGTLFLRTKAALYRIESGAERSRIEITPHSAYPAS